MRITGTSEPCGVDWEAIRLAKVAKKLRFYSLVLQVCRERFRQNKEDSGFFVLTDE